MQARGRWIVAAVVLSGVVASCGGQKARNPDAGIPPQAGADQISETSANPADQLGSLEQVPPFFDESGAQTAAPEGGLSVAGAQAPIEGPLAKGTIEAEGTARLDLADPQGQPTTLADAIPVHLTIRSETGDQGYEFLATIRTIKPKSEGGFLYLTTSTGGGPSGKAVERSAMAVTQDDAGSWSYSANHATTPLGLLNLADLLKLMPQPPADAPETLVVDQFEAVIGSTGEVIVTGAGSLKDGRRVVLMGRAETSTTVPPDAAKEGTEPAKLEGSVANKS